MSNYHSSWKPLFDNYIVDIKKDGIIYPDEKDIYRVFEMDIKEGCLPLVYRVQNSNLSIRVNSKNNYSFQFSNK